MVVKRQRRQAEHLHGIIWAGDPDCWCRITLIYELQAVGRMLRDEADNLWRIIRGDEAERVCHNKLVHLLNAACWQMSRKAKAIHNAVARHGVTRHVSVGPSQLDCTGLVQEIFRSAWWLRMQATAIDIEVEHSRHD